MKQIDKMHKRKRLIAFSVLCILTIVTALNLAVSASTLSPSDSEAMYDLSDLPPYVANVIQSNATSNDYVLFMDQSSVKRYWYLLAFQQHESYNTPVLITYADRMSLNGPAVLIQFYQNQRLFARQFTLYEIDATSETNSAIKYSTDNAPDTGLSFLNKASLVPVIVTEATVIYEGNGQDLQAEIMQYTASEAKKGRYTPYELYVKVLHKQNPSDHVEGYPFYSHPEYSNLVKQLNKANQLLSEEQANALTEYQRGLADGRSDVSSLGNGISSLGINIGSAFKTILNGIALGGITLGDLLLFLCFGVIVLVIILVVIRLIGG